MGSRTLLASLKKALKQLVTFELANEKGDGIHQM